MTQDTTVTPTNASFFDISLPKWPQMLTWGEPVTKEQALEIILRTDDFFFDLHEISGGNNRSWNKWAKGVLGFGQLDDFVKARPGLKDNWRFRSKVQSTLIAKLGALSHEYVRNCWASSSFIYGPHGWVHPDGKIGYIDNVGKWPSVEEVFNEWSAIAKQFPYLDLRATLMSGEQCEDEETHPLVTIRVQDGAASFEITPSLPAAEIMPSRRDYDLAAAFSSGRREQGLPDEVIEGYGKVLKPLVEQAIFEAACELVAPDVPALS